MFIWSQLVLAEQRCVLNLPALGIFGFVNDEYITMQLFGALVAKLSFENSVHDIYFFQPEV